MVGSDHQPIVAVIEDKVPKKRRSFRFDDRLIGHEGLIESITRGWEIS